ncbi:MAG: hypothetical protein M3P33_01400 [bacterium]|nr:hypothetical protein [bacterium]
MTKKESELTLAEQIAEGRQERFGPLFDAARRIEAEQKHTAPREEVLIRIAELEVAKHAALAKKSKPKK